MGSPNKSNILNGITACRWVSNVGTDENNGLGEDFWAHCWHQNVVDTAKFDVDFEAQVGQCLGRCFVDVLDLDTLSGNA